MCASRYAALRPRVRASCSALSPRLVLALVRARALGRFRAVGARGDQVLQIVVRACSREPPRRQIFSSGHAGPTTPRSRDHRIARRPLDAKGLVKTPRLHALHVRTIGRSPSARRRTLHAVLDCPAVHEWCRPVQTGHMGDTQTCAAVQTGNMGDEFDRAHVPSPDGGHRRPVQDNAQGARAGRGRALDGPRVQSMEPWRLHKAFGVERAVSDTVVVRARCGGLRK